MRVPRRAWSSVGRRMRGFGARRLCSLVRGRGLGYGTGRQNGKSSLINLEISNRVDAGVIGVGVELGMVRARMVWSKACAQAGRQAGERMAGRQAGRHAGKMQATQAERTADALS